MRNNSTNAEIILWNHLKDKALLGYKFRRQYSVDQFIMDFYCPVLKLAVELDGNIHLNKEIKEHDENRDAFLKSFGITIIRFCNDDVSDRINIVLDKIADTMKELTTPG